MIPDESSGPSPNSCGCFECYSGCCCCCVWQTGESRTCRASNRNPHPPLGATSCPGCSECGVGWWRFGSNDSCRTPPPPRGELCCCAPATNPGQRACPLRHGPALASPAAPRLLAPPVSTCRSPWLQCGCVIAWLAGVVYVWFSSGNPVLRFVICGCARAVLSRNGRLAAEGASTFPSALQLVRS